MSVFQACRPRAEVQQGELSESIFAARLRDVVENRRDAAEVYKDPAKFFENTFPTEGIRTLLDEALGRLTGKKPASSPVMRLETAFGGGKTHALIALYHASRGKVPKARADLFLDPALLPKKPIRLVAGVVGSDMQPSVGLLHEDTGIKTYTLAGEIAYQLRGKEGYARVRAADEGKSAVGAPAFEELVGDEPCLIMLDELGRFMRDAATVATRDNPKVNLAQTSVATLMSLLEFASSRANVVVVLTLADSRDAFGKETEEIRAELEESRKVSARQERVITPSNEAEMPAIVTHRLFEKIDRAAARETAEAYGAFYASLKNRDSDLPLPDRVHRAEYLEEMRKDYPFHPTFLGTLRRKTSTIPSFQQTRGALRLLARAVRALWEKQPADCRLLHIHHLDFSIDDIANDLTSRLERPQFKQVIEADLVSPKKGTQAHAQEQDRDRVEDGKPPYAYRLASAIFLHSLTQGVASGVDPSELAEAVLTPGDEPAVLKRVLNDLEDRCWFLDYDGDHYRFKTEASLNKLIADESQVVPMTRAKRELEDRIQSVWRSGTFKVKAFPGEPAELDDDAGEPKLAVLHFDAVKVRETDAQQAAPETLVRLAEHSGSMQGFRAYRNNVLFLVADADLVGHTVDQAKRYLAIDRIVSDAARMGELTKDQRDKLKKARETAELEVRVAITRAYRFLFYPSDDAQKKSGGLRRHALPAADQGDVKSDQTAVILRTLKNLGKVLTSDDKPRAPAWLKAKAWPANRRSVPTEEIRREFARRIGLPILLDVNQLKKTIRDGIETEEWIYYDSEAQVGYGPASPPPAVTCSDNTILYEVPEAREKRIPIRGEEEGGAPERCPVCGEAPCRCLEKIQRPEEEERAPLRASGAPAEAFQRLVDLCHDQKIAALRRLSVAVEGNGAGAAKELKSFGLAIPQMGKGSFWIEQRLACEFDGEEAFRTDFRGPWERYKRLKQVTDEFAGEAKNLAVTTTLRAEFGEALDVAGAQFTTIREVFATLPIGRVTVTAEPTERRVGR